ncbi:MAG TPA: GntG family PLP-dependent aldolase [Gaiellaceae bacterium]|nr:GntG family PLP-dependent aldolase [Gaiellaceae bacterium]
MIDLRSDTATRPTLAMREAIAHAEVGDEQRREDPTVNDLERRSAELLGHEEAVFLPTATMANEIAMRVLAERGDEVIAEESSHLLIAELGGPAVFAGLITRPVPGRAGRFSPDEVRQRARSGDATHTPRTAVVAIENTHNSSGGRVWPLEEIDAMAATCRELGLALHLDGARLMNASVASGEAPERIARQADTVSICFSKALGCPLGAIVAGSEERMLRARTYKHQMGGAMRQAGIVAAACVYALDHHVERLAEDHARARRLGETLYEAGVPVDLEQVETNFVQIDVVALGMDSSEALERLRGEGVALTSTIRPGILRAVTHLDVSDDDITRAGEAIPRALGVPARV